MKTIPVLPVRRTVRLKAYDYSQAGGYFVTLCTYSKELYFKNYPALKDIVENEWENISERYTTIELGDFILMPNHLHGIIIINAAKKIVPENEKDTAAIPVGATLAVARQKPEDAQNRAGTVNKRAGASPAPTVGDIIGSFKSLCVHRWLRYIDENNIDTLGKFWQRNYYEHIIRSEHELTRIRRYIKDNPLKWELDRENTLSDNYNISHDHYFRSLYDS
jgi:REP-associated tyrosine transposase